MWIIEERSRTLTVIALVLFVVGSAMVAYGRKTNGSKTYTPPKPEIMDYIPLGHPVVGRITAEGEAEVVVLSDIDLRVGKDNRVYVEFLPIPPEMEMPDDLKDHRKL